MSLAFDRLIEALRIDAVDDSDEHARWHVYRAAVTDQAALDLLREALRAERDPALVSAVVVLLLERVDGSQHSEWIGILSDEHRQFANRRSAELGTLEGVTSGSISVATVCDSLDQWSDWLQLKIAESSRVLGILTCLSRDGRTKRIRRIASESLRSV
ncbi:hypothetical protein OIE71_10440 [Streptomyces sp. NBC_01725]|uniref:hypothetical protein n=1 Tax=Streptomyces sp. NBC_01725 TaxID=2975923 RepID=UPI002E2A0D5A|nr:hypothetical protein [Streptomyces sp. NBC_01725]